MTLLAPTLQAFFTERLISQRDASPRTVASYRDTFRLLLAFAQQQTGKTPCQLDFADLDAPLIAAFLTHLEERPRQQSPQPEQPAGGDPLPLPLRRAAAPRARRHDRQGDRDPTQALPTQEHQLPRHTRDQGAARSAGLQHLARSPRPRPAADSDPDRATRLGTDRPQTPRHHPGHPRPPPRPRQRTQRPRRHPDPRDDKGSAPMARRTPRRARGPDIPNQARPPTQPRRHRAPAHQTRRRSRQKLPVTPSQEHHPTRTTAHQRDAPASQPRRPRDDRALARTRIHQNHPHLRARRPRAQRTSHRPDRPTRRQARPIPPLRHAPRVPREPVIMPTATRPNPP